GPFDRVAAVETIPGRIRDAADRRKTTTGIQRPREMNVALVRWVLAAIDVEPRPAHVDIAPIGRLVGTIDDEIRLIFMRLDAVGVIDDGDRLAPRHAVARRADKDAAGRAQRPVGPDAREGDVA